MGLILDTSLLIADERGKFDMPGFLYQFSAQKPFITAITASELLHGVERAQNSARKAERKQYVEEILSDTPILVFDLNQARVHAQIWADLAMRGLMIGFHDLQIAAAALTLSHQVATLNVREFQRVSGLVVVDATPFRR